MFDRTGISGVWIDRLVGWLCRKAVSQISVSQAHGQPSGDCAAFSLSHPLYLLFFPSIIPPSSVVTPPSTRQAVAFFPFGHSFLPFFLYVLKLLFSLLYK
jgi:hypothetical protein